jgi:hypothetical protein
MRVGAASSAQVRISRDKVEGLMQLLAGSEAWQRPDAIAARALTVRLRAPDGRFSIEAVAPETQWVDGAPGLQKEEHISWRWTVIPQRRGRHRLQLLVTARTVGRDGVGPETATPSERVIEVVVRAGLLRRLVRWVAFLALLGVGAALGRLSQDKLVEDVLDVGHTLWRTLLGLLRTSGFFGG